MLKSRLLSRCRTAVSLAVVTAVVLLGSVVTSGPSHAGSPLMQSKLDPKQVQASIDYLIATYKLTRAEALRRLELQNEADKLDTLLRKERASQYGGMWLDQEHGGILNVAMTKPGAANPYIRQIADRRKVRTVAVAHSLAALTNVRERVAKKVGEGPDATYLPAISMKENRVVLWERAWVAQAKLAGTWDAQSLRSKTWERTLTGGSKASADSKPARPLDPATRAREVTEEGQAADSAVAAEKGLVVQRTLPEPEPLYTPYVDWGFCHPLYCHPYYDGMRGGLRLDILRDKPIPGFGLWGGCTSGFNIRSSGRLWDGWAWVLTAGHCVADKHNRRYIQHNGYDLLLQHGVERNAYPYDYTVLPYVNGTVSTNWLESQSNHNLVLTYCRNGGQDSDSDTPCGPQATPNNTPIRGYHSLGEIKSGWIVCASGSASHTDNYPDSWPTGPNSGYLVGTRCGRVISTDVGINTDLCARAGDSGGPLFSQLDFTAYGILEGSLQTRSGPCRPGEVNDYSPISTILTDINYGYQNLVGRYGTSMHLITSADG